MDEKEIAKAISDVVERKIRALGVQAMLGVWVEAEVNDGDLSQVRSGGSTFRGVPKCSDTAFAAGDTVLLVKGPGTPVMIVGKVLGYIGAELP